MENESNPLDAALTLIKKYEGCRLEAYQDVVGVWTIGWGHTAGVTPGQVITQSEADSMLTNDVATFSFGVKSCVHAIINNNELCALISFAYNLGIGALKSSSLLRMLNMNFPKAEIAAEFLKWDHAGGKVLTGLLRRREEERALFLS